MRLIDVDKYKEEIMATMQCWRISPCLSPSEADKSIGNLKVTLNVLDNQPTAFDLESVIEKLEEKRDYHYAEMEKERNGTDYFSEHIFEENHNRAMAFNEAIEILKSAANATNGKNGGRENE